MSHEGRVVEEGALVLLAVARRFGELGSGNNELFVGEVHETLCVLAAMVSGCRLRLSSDEVLLCCLHVNVGLGQAELSSHRALVGGAHQLLDAASLTHCIRLSHVSEDLADVGGGTARIGGRLP